jgi:hypothetical protein
MLDIVLGRLYGEGLKDLDHAIMVLQEFAAQKLEKGATGKDIDYADVLFNVACYYTKKMEGAAEEDKKGAVLKTVF